MVARIPNELGQRFLAGLAIHRLQTPDSKQCDVSVQPEVGIVDYRKQLTEARVNSLAKPGIYFDSSPPGGGKSTADREALKKVRSGLTVLPTHEQARELQAELLKDGIDAAVFPKRKTGGDQSNCWSDEADVAEAMGLPVVSAICPHCDHRKHCESSGYLARLNQAGNADVKIVTHRRAINGSIAKLADGVDFVTIHEDLIGVLAPSERISEAWLQHARSVIDRLLNDPEWLDWFGESVSFNGHGDYVSEFANETQRIDLFDFVTHLAGVIDSLIEEMTNATKSAALPAVATMPIPTGTERLLYRAEKESTHRQTGPGNWRALLAIAGGTTRTTGVIVNAPWKRPINKGDMRRLAQPSAD